MTTMAPPSLAVPDLPALLQLGQASAMLAHELRSPLTALKGHAQLLLELLPSTDRRHLGAARVVREAERMERLVQDALDLVRPAALRRESVHVLALCRAACPEGARVRVTGPEGLRWSVDGGRLGQVVRNLVENASQADPRGPIQVAVSREGEGLLIAVTDQGPGVDPALAERIFEPFVSGREGGTGLGLALCRRLVEQHGGTLILAASEGVGARFELRLPAER